VNRRIRIESNILLPNNILVPFANFTQLCPIQ